MAGFLFLPLKKPSPCATAKAKAARGWRGLGEEPLISRSIYYCSGRHP